MEYGIGRLRRLSLRVTGNRRGGRGSWRRWSRRFRGRNWWRGWRRCIRRASGAAAGGSGADASDLFHAAVVRVVGPGYGGRTERLVRDVPVRAGGPGRERAPDATTLLKFRRLLERHGCGEVILEVVRRHLASRGVVVNRGTIMDATIVPAARSRKNRARSRDPEMRATRKGNRGYFGLKAHIGADARTKQVHSVATTAANVHDSQQIGALLHGEETRVWGDKAYTNQTAAIRAAAPRARDLTLAKAERNRPLTARQLAANRAKSRVRARVEHPFGVLKGVFGYVKVRYRGLAKNDHQLRVLFALVNVYMFRHALIAAAPATR